MHQRFGRGKSIKLLISAGGRQIAKEDFSIRINTKMIEMKRSYPSEKYG